MKVFNVHAYRFGDRERHSYLVGVYSTSAKAKIAAKHEEAMRGGNKYKCEIIEIEIDGNAKRKTITGLPIPTIRTSCTSQIQYIAMGKPFGTLLPVALFKGVGTESAVYRAISKLVNQGVFIRKTRGVYVLNFATKKQS